MEHGPCVLGGENLADAKTPVCRILAVYTRERGTTTFDPWMDVSLTSGLGAPLKLKHMGGQGGRHILYARRMCSSTYCVSTTCYRVWSLDDTLLWYLVRVATCILIVVVRSRTARRVSSMAWSASSRDRGWFMIRTARNHRLHQKTRMEMASLCAVPTDVLFFMGTSIRGRGVEKQCSTFCKEERRETRLHTPPLILDAARTK